MAKHLIEVFTAGCPVCDDAVNVANSAAGPSCEVKVYDLNKGCETGECRDKAKLYGIKRIPAVVVNGKLSDCCIAGGVSEKAISSAIEAE